MEDILTITLVAFFIFICLMIAVNNLLHRRLRRRKLLRGIEELESLKEKGAVTEEQFESLRNRLNSRQELPLESCTISAEEMMEVIDASLKPVEELEKDE